MTIILSSDYLRVINMYTKPGKFDFLFEGEYAILPEEKIIDLTPEMIVYDTGKDAGRPNNGNSAEKPKLITGTEAVEKFIDNVIADIQNGRKAGEWFAGKRLDMPKTPSNKWGYVSSEELKEFSPDGKQVTPGVNKHAPHRFYQEREIKKINGVFEGCSDRLMADQMLRTGMKPQYVMPFLLARGSHISRAEVEDIYLDIPKEERNAIPIYDDRLGLFTNTYTNRLEELKRTFPEHKYSKNLTASQGTPSP